MPKGHVRAVMRACGLCALTAALACVVTDNSDLPAPTDYPHVGAINPPYYTFVKSVSDPGCDTSRTDPETKFDVVVRYEDTSTDNLFLQLRVNGAAQSLPPGSETVTLRHDRQQPSVLRQTPLLCVKNSVLKFACNTVQVVVATSPEKLAMPISPDDPEVDTQQWILLGAPSGNFADVSPEACAAPLEADGGT